MTQDDWIDLLQLIPADQHHQLVVMSQTGIEVAIDLLLRTEPAYFVFRGRVCGNTDEGRVFFFPYNQVNCVYINRYVKEQEVDQLFTDSPSHSEGQQSHFESTDETLDDLQVPPVTSANPTPLLVPPITSGSGLVPRVPATAMPAIKLPPNVSPGGLSPNPRSSSPMIPPVTSAATSNNGGDTPTPKGSILERLRAQRNAQSKPR
jgi:hypothetical protein